MPSRWRTELVFLAGQAFMEVLPLWMLVTLVQYSAALLTGLSFVQCWALQLTAASLYWSFRRFVLRPALISALLTAAGLGVVWAWQGSGPSAGSLRWLVFSYLCVRGVFMGLNAGKPRAVLRSFGLGTGFCVLFLAFIALSATPRAALPYEALRSLSIAYFFVGAALTGLDLRRTALPGATLTVAAIVSVLGPTLLLLACSVTLVFGPHAASWLVRYGLTGLGNVARVAAAELSLLGTWLVDFLRWLGGLFASGSGTSSGPADAVESREAWSPLLRFRQITWRMASSETLAVLLLLLGTIAMVYIVLAFVRARTIGDNDEAPVHEEQRTTWSWRLLLQPLDRLRRKRAGGGSATPPLTAAGQHGLRGIYRALLSWAAQRGQLREPSTTALEFARQLSAQLPNKSRELSELTDYYSKERYAERPCTNSELERARTIFHEIDR